MVNNTIISTMSTDDSSGMTDTELIELYNDVSKYLWIIISPILFIVGVFGNVLNIIVLIKLKFQRNSTLMLLFILAFTDMAVLIVGLPRYWLNNAVDFDLRTVSAGSCKLSLFLIYFTMQLSSWILVLVTIIRFVKTVLPLRHSKVKVTMKKTLISLAVIVIFLVFLNFHLFITNGIDESGDCGSLTPEYFHFDEYYFVYIDFLFLSIIPALIMIMCNIFIYRVLKHLRTRRPSTSSQDKFTRDNVSRVTWMLVITSSYFIIATLPISIYFIVDSYLRKDADALTESQLDLAWTITYLFEFSHFTLNFYLYTATNKQFRKHTSRITKKLRRSMRLSVPTVESYEVNNSAADSHRKMSLNTMSS